MGDWGVENWVNDPERVERVKELYQLSKVMDEKIKNDRRAFLIAMTKIRNETIHGVDQNLCRS